MKTEYKMKEELKHCEQGLEFLLTRVEVSKETVETIKNELDYAEYQDNIWNDMLEQFKQLNPLSVWFYERKLEDYFKPKF